MTCAESIAIISQADVAAMTTLQRDNAESMALAEHVTGCDECRQRVGLVVAAASELSSQLNADYPALDPATVSSTAWLKVHRARRVRFVSLAASLFALLAVFLFGRTVVSETQRMLAPPPPPVTVTYSLKCLSADQAAALLRPYLPAPQNPRWQAEAYSITPAQLGIRAVTVRAPQEVIDEVPRILARFEQDENAECRR